MPARPTPLLLLLLASGAVAQAGVQPDGRPDGQPVNPAPGTPADDRAGQRPASTDVDAPDEALTQTRRDPAFSLTVSGSYSDSADLDSGAGELGISRLRALFDVTFDLGEKRALTLGAGSERSWYDFENATGLDAGGDPFSDVTDSEVFFRYAAPFNQNTTWFALGSVGLASEDGADLSESLLFTGGGGFMVKSSDAFSWGLGLVVRTQLEDDVLVVPLPQVRWAISDRWTLESHRAGLRLGYAHSDSFSYGVQAEYASRSYRLDEDGPIPDGQATDRRVPVAFFAEYKPAPNFTVTGLVGAALWSNIELLDAQGNDLADDDLNTAVFFGLGARISF